jgi:hypothetical protein
MKNKPCCINKVNLYEMCLDCYNLYFADPNAFMLQDLYDVYLEEKANSSPYKQLTCECGSESYGGTTHSHWCPKGENK